MQTDHDIYIGDARSLEELPADSVDLVVTSPPYPMIEMWDELFASLSPRVEEHLSNGEGTAAFDAMHDVLAEVWDELSRVLVDGGVACINVGDATRTVGGNFRVYQNHARIIEAFTDRGFTPLPEILWRKPVNSAAKFLGSGMTPPNAYVTLEHEYILCFRNGETRRSFEAGADCRYEAAYFQEERNTWFSDLWEDVRGELQALDHGELRDRSAAFPFEIPYRLINMYSVYGDTVLDPFWGTGTTSLAAMVAGRDSVGYELEEDFLDVFGDRVREVPALADGIIKQRLANHVEFVDERREEGREFGYESETYGFPVTAQDETGIQFYTVAAVQETESGYRLEHSPVTSSEFAQQPVGAGTTTLADF